MNFVSCYLMPTLIFISKCLYNHRCKIFGGAGVCGDFPLARALVGLRTLRIADGPDAVHKQSLALLELKKAKQRMKSRM